MPRSASPLPPSSKDDIELWYSRCGAATASAIAIRRGWLQAEFARGGTVLRSLRESEDGTIRDAHHQVINLNEQPDPVTRVNNGTPRPVTVDRLFLERHPELVVRYLAVLLRTSAWAEHNPAEVLELLASEGGGANVDEVLDSHGQNVHRSFQPRLTAEYIQGLDVQKNFLRDFDFLKADVDTQAWVVRGPLAEAERLVRAEPELLEPSGQPQPGRGARRPIAGDGSRKRSATVT